MSDELQPIDEFIDMRAQVYGDPVETFPRIAQVWSGILGHEVTATEVALCQAGLKMVRTQMAPDYADNSDDIEGFLEIFRRIVGEDMVRARTVDEYMAVKVSRWPRHIKQVSDGDRP